MPEVCLRPRPRDFSAIHGRMRLPRPIKNFEKGFAGCQTRCGASELVQLPSSGARRWCHTRLVDEFLFCFRPRSLHAGWTGFPAGCGFFLSRRGSSQRNQGPTHVNGNGEDGNGQGQWHCRKGRFLETVRLENNGCLQLTLLKPLGHRDWGL